MRPGEVEPSIGSRVLLVGHGSSTDPRASRSVERHAEAIRATNVFDEVHTGFVRGNPSIGDAIRSVEDGPLIVVPGFMSAGYYTSVVIPRNVERYRSNGVSVRYTPPVGTHPLMSEIAFQRATLVPNGRDGSVGVALVGHGNEDRPANSSSVRGHVDRLSKWGWFDEVGECYLEQFPRVERLHETFSAKELVVVPMFMADGPHVREDIPVRLEQARDRCRVNDGRVWHLTEPVGTHPLVGSIAVERACSALAVDGGEGWAQSGQPTQGDTIPAPVGGG